MGESRVKLASSQKQVQGFTKSLLRDIRALDRMLEEGFFEIDVTRIGAEQELCLIDPHYKPAGTSIEVLKHLDEKYFTTELAKFNLEANLDPLKFEGACISNMEAQLNELLGLAREAAHAEGCDIILTGILPTIRKYDLEMSNITPKERYYALCKAINQLRGTEYELRLRGIDELHIKHDSPLPEACNTGFQVHMQIAPNEFVKMYNIAQAITGPVLSLAVNSPMLFGRRLWKETRVALFQQSVDTRRSTNHLREISSRVTFGNRWMEDSILDIYKEDIVRYRVLLSSQVEEDVLGKIDHGKAPELHALKVHNSTVYRWNRPCYGLNEGKAHLRIENRVFPSGPTVLDEMANTAFWLGLMNGMKSEVDDITTQMDFDEARSNFVSASRLGLDTKLTWLNGAKMNASALIMEELLPIAEEGLKAAKIDGEDITRYLDVIAERVESGKTGAQWMLNSYSLLSKQTKKDEILATLTASIVRNQNTNLPVHKWEPATVQDIPNWEPSTMLIEEFMTTDLFTVRKDDIIELVAEMMDWQRIRYILVEDKNGKLVGLVTSRQMMKHYGNKVHKNKELPATVKSIMIQDPLTISTEATVIDAMVLMDKYQIGCLPVVKDGKLVGVITEQNFLNITSRLIKRLFNK